MKKERLCKYCENRLEGRSDKIFCAVECKNAYNARLKKEASIATFKTDRILHRNRDILKEILGNRRSRYKVDRMELDRRKFNYRFITGYSINKQGKTYNHIYEYSYMTFSDQLVLIVKK